MKPIELGLALFFGLAFCQSSSADGIFRSKAKKTSSHSSPVNIEDQGAASVEYSCSSRDPILGQSAVGGGSVSVKISLESCVAKVLRLRLRAEHPVEEATLKATENFASGKPICDRLAGSGWVFDISDDMGPPKVGMLYQLDPVSKQISQASMCVEKK